MSNDESLQGGTAGGVEDLYREVILDHFKSPRNKGKIESPTLSNEGVNPLCGDEIEITALLANGIVKDIKFIGHGCAISQASASMMTESIKGKPIEKAALIAAQFKGLLLPDGHGEVPTNKGVDLGDLEALEGVKKYPVRVKCATLAWNTFVDALKNYIPKR
jgi:nitrogen fixation NifU-like protein